MFFDVNPDRRNAIDRILHCQQYWDGIEYLGLAIPRTTNRNPNPAGQVSTAVAQQNNRPNQAPYGIYWDANGNPPVYFSYTWDTHFVFMCGWRINFNIVLSQIL